MVSCGEEDSPGGAGQVLLCVEHNCLTTTLSSQECPRHCRETRTEPGSSHGKLTPALLDSSGLDFESGDEPTDVQTLGSDLYLSHGSVTQVLFSSKCHLISLGLLEKLEWNKVITYLIRSWLK